MMSDGITLAIVGYWENLFVKYLLNKCIRVFFVESQRMFHLFVYYVAGTTILCIHGSQRNFHYEKNHGPTRKDDPVTLSNILLNNRALTGLALWVL